MLVRNRWGPALALLGLIAIAAFGLWQEMLGGSSQPQPNQASQQESASKNNQNPGAVSRSFFVVVRDAFGGAVGLLDENQWTATSTFLLVVVTGLLVLVANSQGRTTKRQLRPYVFVDVGEINNVANPIPVFAGQQLVPTPGNRTNLAVGPIIHFTFKNYGKTPAYKVESWSNMFLADLPLKTSLPGNQGGPTTQSDIGPGGTISKTLVGAILTPAQLGKLRAGTHAIYAYGEITYLDPFRRLWWKKRTTRFRFMHIQAAGAIGISTVLTGCEEGNNAN